MQSNYSGSNRQRPLKSSSGLIHPEKMVKIRITTEARRVRRKMAFLSGNI
jgi:hypothetical protein